MCGEGKKKDANLAAKKTEGIFCGKKVFFFRF
jgi:hypothetical protein